MRTKTGNKKSKTTWTTLTISKETVEDCLSSWLTATGFIEKNQYVSMVKPKVDKAEADVFYPEEVTGYTVRVERINGEEES